MYSPFNFASRTQWLSQRDVTEQHAADNAPTCLYLNLGPSRQLIREII